MTLTVSRRTLLVGGAALSCAALIPGLGRAQANPVKLRAAMAARAELAGKDPLALFNDSLPGPVLKVKRDAPLALSVENALSEPFALTFHGVRGPDHLSGGREIAPGETRDIAFTPMDAGTFWYHASSPALARRALCGGLVVEDADPAANGFAADHLLFIQTFPPESGMPIFPVNGAISPTFEAPGNGRARLRLVNATPIFLAVRVKAAPTYVMAVDGQPAQPFALKDNRTLLTPGGRVDLAVDLGTADPVPIELETVQSPIRIALLVPVGTVATPVAGPPLPLPDNPLPAEIPLQGAARFELPLDTPQGGAANGGLVLGKVKVGETVVLALVNRLDAPVAVHIHGHPARLLDSLDDGWKPWWHDTVPVPPRATVRVAFQAKTPGKWPIIGMRGNDVVANATYEVAGGANSTNRTE